MLAVWTIIVKKEIAAFAALSVAASVSPLFLLYGTYHWEESAVLGCLFVASLLCFALFSWSIVSVRHNRVRAVIGSFVCAYCLWQILQVTSMW